MPSEPASQTALIFIIVTYVNLTYNDSMTTAATNMVRSSRLAVRMTPEQRSTIDMAATLKGATITQWALDHLISDARKDIEEETTIRLSARAFNEFKEALEGPMPQSLQDLLKKDAQWL